MEIKLNYKLKLIKIPLKERVGGIGKNMKMKSPEEINKQENTNEIRNNGQELSQNMPAHWKGTVYKDGGYDYRIVPINFEGTDDEVEEWIQEKADEYGIDQVGYVSAEGRVYKDLFHCNEVEKK